MLLAVRSAVPNTLRRFVSTEASKLADVVENSLPSIADPTVSAASLTTVTQYTSWLSENKPGFQRLDSPAVDTFKPYTPMDLHRSRRVISPLNQRRQRNDRPWAIDQTAAEAKATDPFINLGINLEKEFRNGTLLSAFLTDMGMIKHRDNTGLTWASQRKLAKAVKRARAMGILPSFSKQRVFSSSPWS